MSNELTKDFIWRTQKGINIPVSQMETSHLFYSVRMIFNHTVPVEFSLLGCRRYSGIDSWPIERLRECVYYLLLELSKRDDIKPEMLDQLKQMRDNYNQLTQSKLGKELLKLPL